VVEHTGDNNLVTFRYKLKDVKMSAAEEDFDAAGKKFRAGAIIIPNANASQVEPLLKELGLSGYAMASAPTVASHDLDIPRILYLHSWSRTQDEGWVRAALETYGVPFTYMGDKEVATMSDLRSKYDVIIYPHIGGSAESAVQGVAMTGSQPVPYKKTAETPSFGTPDSTSDIRGGMGYQGLMNIYKFVQDGGTLITEGSTSTIFPEYKLTPGLTVESPTNLFARGSILRGMVADARSPLAYGIGENQIPVYFNGGPVLNAGGAPNFGGFGGRGASVSQNTSPMANQPVVSSFPSLGGAGLGEPAAGGGGGGTRWSWWSRRWRASRSGRCCRSWCRWWWRRWPWWSRWWCRNWRRCREYDAARGIALSDRLDADAAVGCARGRGIARWPRAAR
jgi:hypothetical protein